MAAVHVVVFDHHIDRAVKLDPGHLPAGEHALRADIVDFVADDLAKRAAHAAGDAGLFTMMNMVVADDMTADGFLAPAAFAQGALHAFFCKDQVPPALFVLSNLSLYFPRARPAHLE